MLVIAHAGHILIDAPLFLGPVVILAVALYVSTRRERRRNQQH
ncbi:MAG: hypothetical protein QOC95_1165 [Thermoleophilaceae bacterium]|jgi:hypothetical protein|nr:hypothetical protein [Thermoleophilaceae bacterium]